LTTTGASQLLARTPLRVRLVAAFVALVAVALAITGFTVTTVLRTYLVGQVDEDLGRPLPDNRQGAVPGMGEGGGPFDPARAEYYLLATTAGERLRVGNNGLELDPPALTSERISSAGTEPFTVRATGGGPAWRVVVRPTTLTVNGEETVFVRAISLGDVQATTRRLLVIELLVGGLAVVLMAGVGYLVVRRSLRPLEEVESTAAGIAAGDLSRRVPQSDERTEVGRLSGAFNSMVDQIETAFREREASAAAARTSEDRMRRFVADASHELRTPLTSIRGFAELYRQGAVRETAELDRMMRRVEDEASRMGLLVEDLLLLARLDQQRPLRAEPVDLLEVVSDAVHDARVLAPDRQVDLDVAGDEAPVVLGDDARLRQVVTNLVSNAVTHTPAGTPVAVTLRTSRRPGPDGSPVGWVRVGVHDQGPGLSDEDKDRVFERFYRGDKSRTRAAGGSGLGLSIVAALVAAHHGVVSVESEPGRGSVFLVDLPLLGSAADGPPAHVSQGAPSLVTGPEPTLSSEDGPAADHETAAGTPDLTSDAPASEVPRAAHRP
jgi:two-component system, OmpR family, sensor kinase